MNIDNNTHTNATIEGQLRATIHAYCDNVIPQCENSDYRDAVIRLFEEEGSEFLIACIRKFASGQLKYGGNFFRADHSREARAEHIDLFNYNAGASMKSKYPELCNIVEDSEGDGHE